MKQTNCFAANYQERCLLQEYLIGPDEKYNVRNAELKISTSPEPQDNAPRLLPFNRKWTSVRENSSSLCSSRMYLCAALPGFANLPPLFPPHPFPLLVTTGDLRPLILSEFHEPAILSPESIQQGAKLSTLWNVNPGRWKENTRQPWLTNPASS